MIKVEISAETAEGLASQFHEFVNTFVNLARASDPPAALATTPEKKAALKPAPKAEEPKRKRKAAPVVETAPEPEEDEDEDLDNLNDDDEEEEGEAEEEVSPDNVRAVLNEVRAKLGNDALGKLVTQFAPKFSEVPKTAYPALYKAARKRLAA